MYPILLDLGVWQLRSYGVFVALAVAVGVWWSAREAERRGFARQLVYDAAWAIAVAGIAGARIWYVVFSEPQTYLARPWEILAIWHGGLSMHGALVAGTLVGAWWIRRHGFPFWRFADAVVPGLILGQAAGQIACLLNGDTYGKPIDLPWAIVFTHPQAMAPLGVPLHPLQVYELLAYLAVFLVVQRVARSAARDGAVVLTYAVLYGVVRFAIEFFRGDPPMVAGSASDERGPRRRGRGEPRLPSSQRLAGPGASSQVKMSADRSVTRVVATPGVRANGAPAGAPASGGA